MNYSLLITTLCLCFPLLLASSEDCKAGLKDCDVETEYNAYITCLHQSRRTKRSACSDNDCEYVDCTKCENCIPNCPDCGECSFPCRMCCSESCSDSNCCRKTCNNQCKTTHCRSECKKECTERIESGGSYVESKDSNKHNITTIINLHNIINNTNVIDMPININNTNYNNITLKRSDGYNVARYQEPQDSCCTVIGPRQCEKTDQFPFLRCYHTRKHRCGVFCQAPIVHAQPQQYCDDHACHQKTIYVPQPQPSCYRTPYWPYVNCGNAQSAQCNGCYDHYTKRHHHVDFGKCTRCYDEGFGQGSYYRQGPFYRPGNAHTPSCLQTGSCGLESAYQYPAMQFPPPVMPPVMPPMGGGMYYGAMGGYPMPYPNFGYPQFTYFSDDGNITVTQDNTNSVDLELQVDNDESNQRPSRYALISIEKKPEIEFNELKVKAADAAPEKDKRVKRKNKDRPKRKKTTLQEDISTTSLSEEMSTEQTSTEVVA